MKVGESGASEEHSAVVRIASCDRVPLTLKSRLGGRLHRALGSANDAPRVSGRRRRRGQCERKKQWQHTIEEACDGEWRQESRAGFPSSGCSNGSLTICAQTVARTSCSDRVGDANLPDQLCQRPDPRRASRGGRARRVARRAGRVVPIAHRDRRAYGSQRAPPKSARVTHPVFRWPRPNDGVGQREQRSDVETVSTPPLIENAVSTGGCSAARCANATRGRSTRFRPARSRPTKSAMEHFTRARDVRSGRWNKDAPGDQPFSLLRSGFRSHTKREQHRPVVDAWLLTTIAVVHCTPAIANR